MISRFKSQNRTLICRHSEMARIFKSTTRISSTSMVFSLTTNTLAQILISPVHSNVKTILCVQKLVIKILCASLAYKGKVCIRANVAHLAGAYPGFRSMKRLGVFLLPPGWDASPSQGYPPALSSPVPIYTPGWREAP